MNQIAPTLVTVNTEEQVVHPSGEQLGTFKSIACFYLYNDTRKLSNEEKLAQFDVAEAIRNSKALNLPQATLNVIAYVVLSAASVAVGSVFYKKYFKAPQQLTDSASENLAEVSEVVSNDTSRDEEVLGKDVASSHFGKTL